jgi:hypothetical protein
MQTRKKMNLTIFAMIFLLGGAAANSSARLNPLQESLRGIKAIDIAVVCSEEIRDADLTQQDIQQDIQTQLEEAGVKILPRQTGETDGERCRLMVLVKVYRPADLKTFIYNLKVYFVQKVALERMPEVKVDAVTWELSWLAHGSKERIAETIPANLKIMTDNFIRDYRLANPRGVLSGNYDGSIISISSKKGKSPSGTEVKYQYVSSKNSQVFHSPNCRSAKRIKPENLVGYISRDEAIKAGKRPCKVCKP